MRIDACFANLRATGRKGLIPYIAAGDPSPSLTVPLMCALVAAGADIIELGIPFSDPMADGPAVQRATQRALEQGVGLAETLAMVRQFRTGNGTTPLVLMGYANPIERVGWPTFARQAHDAGVDGVLVVDYPPEESDASTKLLRSAGIDPIFMVAPTTTEKRIEALAGLASGYLYYVSLRGTTGLHTLDIAAVAERLPIIRRHAKVPIGVGFGIRDAAGARAIAAIADAVVVGSRIIEEMEAAPPGEAVDAVCRLVRSLRTAIDSLAVPRGTQV